MEPESRAEWACPLEVGTHLRSFYSALSEPATTDVLCCLDHDRALLEFLTRHPLGRLEFSDRLPRSNWLGLFDRRFGDVVINAFRRSESYGRGVFPATLH